MAGKTIHVMLDRTSAIGRGVSTGLAEVVRQRGDWSLNLMVTRVQQQRDDLSAASADAIIGRITPEAARQWTGRHRRRLVQVSRGWDIPGAAIVTCDDEAIGRLGAEHLLTKPLERFAWFGLSEGGRRQEAFVETIEAAGKEVDVFANDRAQRSAKAWLRRLHRPSGVMTFNDDQAVFLLSMAAELDLRVPRDLAVVGADHDVLGTMFSSVAISSVDPNFVEVGRQAGRALEGILDRDVIPPEPIRVRPVGVVEGHSTDFPALDDELALAAARLIRREACNGLTVGQLADALAAGRRTVERHYSAAFGETLLEGITRVRMQQARGLLETTLLSVEQVARQSGHSGARHFATVFGKHEGVSPSEYRRRHGESASARPAS
jgi:LacI family transcriptional regulator